MALCIEESHVTSVEKNRFGEYVIIVLIVSIMIYASTVRQKIPISGSRWEGGSNDRTHTMIKIRVPTPSLVRRRPTEFPMYPGIA
jgi:hypothetical protein